MLGMVIRRHWKLYGHHIESMLGDTGANQGPLMSLVQRLQVLPSLALMPVVIAHSIYMDETPELVVWCLARFVERGGWNAEVCHLLPHLEDHVR